jgi:ABC-2 type transport system ATP-binding protein
MELALELEGVGKAYKGFTLADVTFSLPRGYIMGLIGPNGAGKTTLIKLILNLVRRHSGVIRVLGLDNLVHEAEIKSRIGFVPDEPSYYADVTLRDLAAATALMYRYWDESLFQRLVSEFQLPMQKKFKALSHGTKTKFALGLALSHRAEFVILDEPTSGLDPVFRRELLDKLSALMQDERVSILFSTHITSDLEKTADFVTFLREGRVIFSRPKDEILETWGVVRGGKDLLDAGARAFFDGIRLRELGFEGLTSHVQEARRIFGARAVVERASLDDIMVLMGGKESHAA